MTILIYLYYNVKVFLLFLVNICIIIFRLQYVIYVDLKNVYVLEQAMYLEYSGDKIVAINSKYVGLGWLN